MRAPLATFQYIVLRTIQRLGKSAYGMAIEDYITAHLSQLASKIDIAQIYITTKRLSELGFVDDKAGPAPNGSGHTVKFYRVSEDGVRALKEAAAFFAAVAQLEGVHPHDKTTMPSEASQDKRTRARPRARSTSSSSVR
jgi:DNA-binding PadR family transcriptional regulator